MKRLILILGVLALAATPAFADGGDDQGENNNSQGGHSTPGIGQDPSTSWDSHHGGSGGGATGGERPTAPVPEPGTMALASMGLIALGAAARRRRKI